MPVYKKKSTSAKTTLSWDGYAFPWNTEVTTNGFVLPHDDLELITDTPLPDTLFLVNQALTLDGATPVTLEIPACEEYLITIRCVSGTINCYPNIGSGVKISLDADQSYFREIPIKRSQVVRWVFTSTAAATGTVLVERIR